MDRIGGRAVKNLRADLTKFLTLIIVTPALFFQTWMQRETFSELKLD